jgi:hypothetical protein
VESQVTFGAGQQYPLAIIIEFWPQDKTLAGDSRPVIQPAISRVGHVAVLTG